MKNTAFSILTRSLLFSIIFAVVGLLGLSLYVAQQSYMIGDSIYPNVYINGVPFGNADKKEVDTYFNALNKELNNISVVLTYDEEKVATFSASMLNLHYDVDTPKTQALQIGRSENKPSRIYQKIVTILNLSQFHFNYTPDYDNAMVIEKLELLKESYEKPPTDALFEVQNGRVIAFKEEADGIALQTEKAELELERQLSTIKIPLKENGEIVNVNVEKTISKPKTTLSQVNDFGIVERIGTATSDYTGSIPGRVHNVALGTSKFNGVLIPKGEVFSFNKTVGDISSATGYQPAYIIKQGATVLGDGGGICQVSTTLFRAALDAGLPIIERTAHAYRVHYYENDRKPGFDATVFSPTVDLKFKNDTEGSILIQTSIDKTTRIVTFTLYGKRDGRIRTISDATIWDVVAAPESRYQDDPTLPTGTKKQIDWAAPGTKAKFHYRVEKDGEVIQDRDFVSVFRPWQAVFLVGTGG